MGRYESDDTWGDIDLRQPRFADDRPQSGLGMASIALAIIAAIIGGGAVIGAALIDSMPMADQDQEDLLMGLMFLVFAFGGGMGFAGLALGFAGTVQSHRNPALAILGTVLNILLLVGMSVVACIGILSELG